MRFQRSRDLGGMDEDYSWLSGDNRKLSAPKNYCASRKSRNVRAHSAYPSFIIPADAYCFRVNAGNSGLDSTFACCPGARDPRFAPTNRHASEVRCKTPKVDLWGPSVLDLCLPPPARLLLIAGTST